MEDLNAHWMEGDWNCDGLFDSGDFVAAFTDANYERTAVAAAMHQDESDIERSVERNTLEFVDRESQQADLQDVPTNVKVFEEMPKRLAGHEADIDQLLKTWEL